MRKFLRIVYFLLAGLAFFTLIHAITVIGFHNWKAVYFGLPIGLIVGYVEVGLWFACGVYSFCRALKEFKA